MRASRRPHPGDSMLQDGDLLEDSSNYWPSTAAVPGCSSLHSAFSFGSYSYHLSPGPDAQQYFTQPQAELGLDLAAQHSVAGLGAPLPLDPFDAVSTFSTSASDNCFGYDTPTSSGASVLESPGTDRCSCDPAIIRELSAVPDSCYDNTLSSDVRLSRLKHGIEVCAGALHCRNCDDIMIVGVLIGRIIDGFETLLAGAGTGPFAPFESSGVGMTNSLFSDEDTTFMGCPAQPSLSWGMLQIEGADEAELKHQLFLLHFRRLEKLVQQFSASTRRPGTSSRTHGKNPCAYAMACGRIHSWLEQRVRVVKEAFAMQ